MTSLPYLSFAPYYVAQAEGYFAEEGLEVEFVELGGEEATPLLIQGELDVIVGIGAYYLNAIARGAEIKVVADKGHVGTTDCSPSALVVRRELIETGEVDSVARLKGRTMPLRSASMEHYFLSKLLDTAGLALMDSPWTYAGLFLLIAVFHSGVRLGRKVYLVDMASQESRSAYVAISNTVIGVAMLAGGAVGVLADLLHGAAVIALLGLVSLVAALYIARLPEVSG